MKKFGPLIVCSFIAILLGAGSGQVTSRKSDATVPSANNQHDKTTVGPSVPLVREIKPIVANLSAPPGAWVRVELALAISGQASPKIDLQINQFATDTTDFLRSVSARQLEGPNGLRRLREDLLERARVRIGQEANAVLIQTLVVQ